MCDYKAINKKLNKLQNQYEFEVSKFKKFSPLGNIQYKNYSNSYDFNFKVNIVEPESNSTYTNKSIKQLLKLIHPDKINILFGSDFDLDTDLSKLLKCSNKIIQENMDFIQAINLLHSNIPTEIFKSICSKLKLSDQDINKIIQVEFDETIDKHFDKDFLDLVAKYNKLKSKTIYNYIYSKVSTLFSNFTKDLNNLLSQISKKIERFELYSLNSEEKQMAREEFRLESLLENKEISINNLSEIYSKSEFAKSLKLIKENFSNLSFDSLHLKITTYMYCSLDLDKYTEQCAKQLYTNYKNSF